MIKCSEEFKLVMRLDAFSRFFFFFLGIYCSCGMLYFQARHYKSLRVTGPGILEGECKVYTIIHGT